MVIVQSRSRRSSTGGRYHSARKKRKFEIGRSPSLTKVDETRSKKIVTKGKSVKVRLLKANVANLFDPKAKTFSKVKIVTVVENPANRHYIRRNIMTKGCIIQTEKGNARVTSRPGQDGTVNAILVK